MATRSRNWASIGYPESLKEDWLSILTQKGVQALISPLHNKDVFEKDTGEHKKGEKKKDHFHFIFIFDSVKSQEQVQNLFQEINKEKAPLVVQVLNLRGCVRYLIHKDNKEKAQYSQDDIINLGGFDLDKFLTNSQEKEDDVSNNFIKILNLFEEYQITSFSDACSVLFSLDLDLFTIFRKNAFFFTQLIKERKLEFLKKKYGILK